jgi:hypothetical protein
MIVNGRTVMSMRPLLAVAAAVLVSTGASDAQAPFNLPVPPPADGTAGTRVFVGRDAGEVQLDVMRPAVAGDLLFVEPLEGGQAVTGAPYSADAVTETTQALADGNRISRKSSVQVARDGRGRERREHQAMMVGPMVAQRSVALVTITDPVAGTAVTIDHQRQVATRMQMRRWAGPSGPETQAAVGGATIGFAPARGAVTATGGATMQWTMAAPADIAPPAPVGERTSEILEPQTIEGVRADGTRTTVTIPAGAIGNELPIAIATERWYSPELKTVVLSRRSDPRFGETVFRLVNLVRGEPGADLFEIPAGYRLEEPKLPPLPR